MSLMIDVARVYGENVKNNVNTANVHQSRVFNIKMGYVSDFSPDGKLFGLLDSDGKLKIWDTADSVSKREYVPSLHLSAPCTCFVWFTVCTKKASAKVRKEYENVDSTLYIALGTSKGGVELYSYATGEVEIKLKGNGHTGSVTSICLHDDSTLYTSGEDCQIVEWSLTNKCEINRWSIGNVIPTCIVSLPKSDRLLIGCKELSLWSLKDYKCKSKFTGHAADVSSMKLLQWKDSGEEFVLTTAKSYREISLWMMDGKENAQATFLMESAASFVSCTIVDKGFTIAAVTGGPSAAVVHLFIVKEISGIIGQKPGKSPINPKVTLSLASDLESGVTPIPIVAATLNFSARVPQHILIGYGSPLILRFENIEYNTKEKKQAFERQDPRVQINRQQKTKENFNTIVPINNDSSTIYQAGSITRKIKSDRKKDGNTVPLIDRLRVLSVEPESEKATSLVQLLTQALHNHDAALLRSAFVTKDEELIRSTLKRLPADFIPSLVHELTSMTEKKTANVQIAVCWIKILLQTHFSQLMALGKAELDERFGKLIGIIDLRTEALKPLTRVSGRLDLLLNQIKRNTDDDPIFNHENLLVYEDDNEDNDASDDDIRNNDQDSSTEEDDFDMMNGDSSVKQNGENSSTCEEEEESDDEMGED